MKEEFYVISFESTHYAMMIEKRLKEKFKTDMIPTPRSITASCGLSLKIGMNLMKDVVRSLKVTNMDSAMFHLYKIRKTERGDEVTALNWEEL
ncbi:MAG: DUF3343 domain-containing protein [Dehalobacterium sp.]